MQIASVSKCILSMVDLCGNLRVFMWVTKYLGTEMCKWRRMNTGSQIYKIKMITFVDQNYTM